MTTCDLELVLKVGLSPQPVKCDSNPRQTASTLKWQSDKSVSTAELIHRCWEKRKLPHLLVVTGCQRCCGQLHKRTTKSIFFFCSLPHLAIETYWTWQQRRNSVLSSGSLWPNWTFLAGTVHHRWVRHMCGSAWDTTQRSTEQFLDFPLHTTWSLAIRITAGSWDVLVMCCQFDFQRQRVTRTSVKESRSWAASKVPHHLHSQQNAKHAAPQTYFKDK